ncbi:MAG: hypothetical protein K8I27_12830 [Planctomycetes bacterium]|nr:hypothetical protein [Planctomycetota bacterium]
MKLCHLIWLMLPAVVLGGCVRSLEHPEVIILNEVPVQRVSSRADANLTVVGPDGLYRQRYGNFYDYLNFYTGDSIELEAWGSTALRAGLKAFPGVPVTALLIEYAPNDEDLRIVAALTSLRVLWIKQPERADPELVRRCFALKTLEWRGIGGSTAPPGGGAARILNAGDIAGLENLDGVEALWLKGLGNENIKVLGELPALASLNRLRLQAGDSDLCMNSEALDAIGRCPSLQEVAFVAGPRTSALACFRIPHLVELDLWRAYPSGPVIDEIRHATGVRLLALRAPDESESASGAALGEALAALPALRRLALETTQAKVLASLKTLPSLEVLTLRCFDLSPAMIRELGGFKQLKFLNVEETTLREERVLDLGFPASCRVRCIRPNEKPNIEGLFGG